jgi:hypothetical protein
MGPRLPFSSHAQKRLSIGYSPQDNFLRKHAECPFGHMQHMCPNGHSACRRKKHDMEDKLSKIFEAL